MVRWHFWLKDFSFEFFTTSDLADASMSFNCLLLGQGTPVPSHPHPIPPARTRRGYPAAPSPRSGSGQGTPYSTPPLPHAPTRTRRGYPFCSAPSLQPGPGQIPLSSPSPLSRTCNGQNTARAVHDLRFHTGGLSCLFF